MKKIKNLLALVKLLIHKHITSPLQYARELGVTVGEDNFLPDKNCWSSEPYLISIGSHCQITVGVRFLTHGGGHVVRDLYPNFNTFGKIVIGDWVYIGNNSLIMPGVIIEDHVLIAAGSVVTKSIPRGVVVGGNPARIICNIEDYYKKNKRYDIEIRGLSPNDKRLFLQSMEESKFVKKQYLKNEEN